VVRTTNVAASTQAVQTGGVASVKTAAVGMAEDIYLNILFLDRLKSRGSGEIAMIFTSQ
jgi:hypothetical protein